MKRRAAIALALLVSVHTGARSAPAHVLNHTVAASGGCPQLNRLDTSNPSTKKVDRRWSTSPSPSVKTSTGSWTGSLQNAEIHNVILESFSVWTSVSGTTLTPAMLAALEPYGGSNPCNSFDGFNTICFNKDDSFFTGGVLAFTRVFTSDVVGEKLGAKTSAFVGEILDADIYFRPPDSQGTTFATPQALAANAASFDLESVLIHELGHMFGFSHSSVWRAMMWPFAPAPGQYLGDRPSLQAPDGPLADDDRVGLRVLYPDLSSTANVGMIRGRVLPANPIALADTPTVTGIFGAQVVALDADTGQVVAAILGGWSCNPLSPPTQFDGTYVLEGLPVPRSYKVYVEPLDGPTDKGHITIALDGLCKAGNNNICSADPQQIVNTNFTTRIRPGP